MAVKRSNVRMMVTFRKAELEKIQRAAKKRGLTLTKFINQILREYEVI